MGEEDLTSISQQWGGDFTHIKTNTGWLHHAAIMDLFSRKILGRSFSRIRNEELTKSALKMALNREVIEECCFFHSNQGIDEYRALLNQTGMRKSISRKGNPLDNARWNRTFIQ